MSESIEMKRRFNEEIQKLKFSKGNNTQLFTRDEYYSMLTKVQVAKDKYGGKTPEEYQRLSRYDILKIGTLPKLIVPVKNETEPIRYYCCLEETFDIIHETHICIGHGGRNRMMKELKLKYKNITKEFVALYLALCEPCQKKLSVPKKGLEVKPIKSSGFYSRCQVDLIDMQTQADGDFKFIMAYQDHLTKFVILKPLQTKRAEEVAYNLLDIFTTFGAPCILHSDNGKEFVNQVIVELCQMWDEPKIVHGRPRHSRSQGSVERANRDIEKMVLTWLETNKTTKWSEGLKFLQFMKNRAYHSGINRSPYEAMFGCKPKVGLKSVLPSFPGMPEIITEDDLEAILIEGDTRKVQSISLDRADDAEGTNETYENLDVVAHPISVTDVYNPLPELEQTSAYIKNEEPVRENEQSAKVDVDILEDHSIPADQHPAPVDMAEPFLPSINVGPKPVPIPSVIAGPSHKNQAILEVDTDEDTKSAIHSFEPTQDYDDNVLVWQPSLCRCCLRQPGEYDLGQPGNQVLRHTLAQCFGVELSHLLDGVEMRMICSDCANTLQNAHSFRQQAMKAEQKFKEHMLKVQQNRKSNLEIQNYNKNKSKTTDLPSTSQNKLKQPEKIQGTKITKRKNTKGVDANTNLTKSAVVSRNLTKSVNRSFIVTSDRKVGDDNKIQHELVIEFKEAAADNRIVDGEQEMVVVKEEIDIEEGRDIEIEEGLDIAVGGDNPVKQEVEVEIKDEFETHRIEFLDCNNLTNFN